MHMLLWATILWLQIAGGIVNIHMRRVNPIDYLASNRQMSSNAHGVTNRLGKRQDGLLSLQPPLIKY